MDQEVLKNNFETMLDKSEGGGKSLDSDKRTQNPVWTGSHDFLVKLGI